MQEQTSHSSSLNAGQKPETAQPREKLRKKSRISQRAGIPLNIPDYEPSDMGELLTDSFTSETERIYLPKLG